MPETTRVLESPNGVLGVGRSVANELISAMSQQNDYTPDELDAIWVSYQTENGAACPYCESMLEFDLTQDALETGGDSPPIVTIQCPGCGRQGLNNPGERNDSEQNPT